MLKVAIVAIKSIDVVTEVAHLPTTTAGCDLEPRIRTIETLEVTGMNLKIDTLDDEESVPLQNGEEGGSGVRNTREDEDALRLFRAPYLGPSPLI
jgi:hypothetical protein